MLDLKVREYAHINDERSNDVYLAVGPCRRRLARHETIALPATPFHRVPRDSYAVVENPHVRKAGPATGAERPVLEPGTSNQVLLRMGESEYRYHVDGFPLFPGERLVRVEKLRVVAAGEALLIRYQKLCPKRDVSENAADAEGVYEVGDHRVLHGPATYYPRPEEVAEAPLLPVTVAPGHALHCTATQRFVELDGGRTTREDGESYLRLVTGTYWRHPCESVQVVPEHPLGRNGALHLRVAQDYVDNRPFAAVRARHAGELFMITGDDCGGAVALHPHDRFVRRVERIHVGKGYFCITGRPAAQKSSGGAGGGRGRLIVVPGSPKPQVQEVEEAGRRVYTATSFFLGPDEVIVEPPRPRYVLDASQSLVLRAREAFTDHDDGDGGSSVARTRGEEWLLRGPCAYMPPAAVEVVPDPRSDDEVRETLVLAEGEGVYVRDTRSGAVRTVAGPATLQLQVHEALWHKPLPPQVAALLTGPPHSAATMATPTTTTTTTNTASPIAPDGRCLFPRQYGDAVVYYTPHRSVTQLYNYRAKSTRIVFGPNRVLLGPEEEFTVVLLSGSPWNEKRPGVCLPKEPGRIQALCLFLGPGNMTDIVEVETRDHAQLALQLCYDWYFDCPVGDEAAARRCFNVNDFVADACSFVASRIRAAVAALPFEKLHTNSAEILRQAVFGTDAATGAALRELRFPANQLVITSVDTQSMEVLDARTREGLQKSVKIAIDITTHAQQAKAQELASAREQEARGRLDRQRMADQVQNEEHRRVLLEEETRGLSIVQSGKSTAVAAALSRAGEVAGDSVARAAAVRAQKEQLSFEVVAAMQRRRKVLQMEQERALAAAAQDRATALAAVRADLMAATVEALGPETIAAVAKAGPELQVRLLKSLGLEGFLVSDGSAPINLFDTAAGLTGTASTSATPQPADTVVVQQTG